MVKVVILYLTSHLILPATKWQQSEQKFSDQIQIVLTYKFWIGQSKQHLITYGNKVVYAVIAYAYIASVTLYKCPYCFAVKITGPGLIGCVIDHTGTPYARHEHIVQMPTKVHSS